jgi:integrase
MPTTASHGTAKRTPVYSGTHRVRGLVQRALTDGTIVFEVRRGSNGTYARLDATTKTDAIREAEALRTDQHRGVPVRTSSLVPTIAEVADEWADHLDARVHSRDPARRYSPRTAALYRQRLHDHITPTLGHLHADQVTVADLRRMIDRLAAHGYAPGTITSSLNITSGLLRYAVKQGYVARNVARDLDRDDRPSAKRMTEPRYLDANQVAKLLAALGDTYRPIAAACAYAGLRISEALGLQWSDVDLDAGTITVRRQLDADGTLRGHTKTLRSSDTIPILPALDRELRAHRARQAAEALRRGYRPQLVFTTMRGQPQSRRNALRALHRAGTAAGLNPLGSEAVGLHDLRHSLVGLALANGLSIAEAAALARHASPAVTVQVYAGLSDTARAGLGKRLTDAGIGV